MPSPSAARILVADDQIQICRLVRDVLRRAGYAVDIRQDGRGLISHYEARNHSLVILDTLLVHASGLEVVMKLRDRGDRVPIILMYGSRNAPDQLESFAFTYRVDVLRKPFGVGELRFVVERAFRTARSD